MDDFYIRLCECYGDTLYVVEQIQPAGEWQWQDIQIYKYEPTRFRALYQHAPLRFNTYFLNEVLIRLKYPNKMWELRRKL